MPFPEINKRFIYGKNPLKKVICQLRFPPILKIDSEIPSEFQEIIRNEFPLYNSNNIFQQEQILNPQQINSDLFNQLTNKTLNKNHEFSSSDNIWKINLTRTFISLSTSSYRRWEEFYEKLLPAFEALMNIYNPPFFTRIGLRYVDIIDKYELGLEKTNWAELLQNHILGLLATDIKDNIQSFENTYELTLSDKESRVRISNTFVLNMTTKEKCFSIDSDFHVPVRIETNIVKEKLDYLHSRSTNLLQWIIKEKLHDAMDPLQIT